MAIRVVLADDHAMFRVGLKAVLSVQRDIEVVGEANDAFETLRVVEKQKPDVLILDLSMPGGMSGARIAEESIRIHPRLKVVVLTMHEDEFYLKELFRAGAKAFVLKRSQPEVLLQAIRTAFMGQHYVDPAFSEHFVSYLFQGSTSRTRGRLEVLTEREQEVLRLLALGHTNAEVAERLHISRRTVETHRKNLMDKLGLQNRAEMVRFALENGLVKLA